LIGWSPTGDVCILDRRERCREFPPRSPFETLLLTLAFALTTATLALRIARAAPLSLHLPPTVLTNAHPASRPVAAYLIFLARVRWTVPAGARVRVVAPREPTGDIPMNFEIAVGQLPRQRVRPGNDRPESGDWVAAYPTGVWPGTPFLRLSGGDLFRR
jgi:hypothetical protein